MNIIKNFKVSDYNGIILDVDDNTIDNSDILSSLISKFVLGNFLSSSTQSQTSSGTTIVNSGVASIFGNHQDTSMLLVTYYGFLYSTSSFFGSDITLEDTSSIVVGGNCRIRKSPTGSFYFHLHSGTSYSSSSSMETRTYENGKIIVLSNANYLSYFILCDGAIYYYSNKADAVAGYLNQDSAGFRKIADFNTNKLYVIAPSMFTMSGIVTDYYKNTVGGVKIIIYLKSDNRVIGETISDDNGEYTIDVLARLNDECYMVFFAPPNVQFQSKVIDNIIIN